MGVTLRSMISYIVRRLLLLVPVLFVVATAVFFLLHLVPGDPVDFILGENALPATREVLAHEQHFDEPLYRQYFFYMRGLLQGSMGKSYFTHEAVARLIGERYPATLELACFAIFWAVLFAVPLGVLSSLKKGSVLDQSCLLISLVGISVPSFYLGPLLVLLFSITLDWFPVSGRELTGAIILPSVTMGAAMAAILMRITRSSMLDVLTMDYIRTAHAKGQKKIWVIFKHALGSALVPVVAILGLQFGTLLAGAIVTEKIFSWPGLGSLMLDAISRRDYSVVQGCVLIIAASYVVVNLVTDILYTKLDPRIELS